MGTAPRVKQQMRTIVIVRSQQSVFLLSSGLQMELRRLNIRNDYKATSLASCFQVIVRFLSSSSTLISLSNQRSLYRDIFQRIMLSANRLWHQDAKGTRPPEIRGTRAHSTPSIQPAPTTYSTFEGFFDQEGPFSVNDIKEFARLESKWPPEYLPHHVKDGAALRLFTWTARKPSPHEHLKEAIKRLPFLEKASNLRPFFTKYARTNFEPRGEGATSRCPLCASHLLGFPMADHSIQQCPLDELTGDDRLTFLAINHAGYCQRCNARSPAHYQNKCEQNKKKCPHCKQYGHTATLPLCIDDELKHLVNEDLTAKVNGIRENFLKQLREKMSNGTVFHYRLYVDSSYNFQTPSHPERLTGWKYYEDKARKFPEIQKHKYSNFHKNLEAAYPTMQPEELLKGWVQDIPFFSPLMFNYLQEIGYLVTRVRNSMKLDGRYLPPFPYENQHRSPPRQLSQEPKQSGSQPSTSGTQRPLPTRSEIPVRPWRSPPIIIPPSVQDARDLDPRRQDSSVSGSGIAQLEIFRARYRNHGMRPLTAPTTSSSSSTTNTVELPIESSLSAHQSYVSESEDRFTEAKTSNRSRLSSFSSISDHAPLKSNGSDETIVMEDTSEMENEMKTAQITRAWCGQVICIKDKPARFTFEKKAFQRMTTLIPEGLRANIIKAQTLIFLLCGSDKMQAEDFSSYSVAQIKQYNSFLMEVAQANVEERLLLVVLEGKVSNFCSAIMDGSHHLPIPSIDVFYSQSADESLQKMTADQYKWKTPYANPTSRWFRDVADDKEVHEKNLQVRFTPYSGRPRNTELLKQCVNMPIPRGRQDLFTRLQWLQPFLIKSPVDVSIGRHENRVIHGYCHALMALAVLLLEIDRATNTKANVKVTVADCYKEIVMTAAAGHSIVFPTIEIFSEYPLAKWNIWLSTAWDLLMEHHDWTDACSCHNAH
ncbi:hypothetical protein B9Z55_015233 [Caenorhabditis nigoni]|uniref:Uncharacterized protein n=2 Tax=Caenorhabditis nigoni TaxID=1611254 RepID=A0A2G5U992_9PELO|nr:hypothetical protein B9Z55_015233 [Caenorhabditis nigoni]